jgi:hypothetical protein
VKFDQAGLEETVRLLRVVTGSDVAPVEAASALDNIREALRLTDVLGDAGDLVRVESRLVPADGTHEAETWVVLQPTELLKLRAASQSETRHAESS